VFHYERPVRFAEIDAARMVFFARFCDYCHEAIEALFDRLDGGYARLTVVRDIGVPTVHIEFDFKKPLRLGDIVMVDLDVLRVGERSVTFRHTLRRKSDAAVCAVARHVVVTATMSGTATVRIPDDLRRLLMGHLVPVPTDAAEVR
jgi:4-hydroxybenzoyl-CoA thioesterase